MWGKKEEVEEVVEEVEVEAARMTALIHPRPTLTIRALVTMVSA